jgi:O-antigen ligase
MLAFTVRRGAFRLVSVGLATGMTVLAVLSMSRAVTVLFIVSLVVLIAAVRGSARLAVGLAACVFAVALVVTAAIGIVRPASDSSLGRVVEGSLGERRVALWNDAFVLMTDRVWGVGPGRFQETSPTARGDVDAAWAHHGFLQQGAEGGVVAFVLSVALFVWAFVVLWSTPRADVVTGLGAAAVAALGIHATVDYVLHFPALVVVAAALAAAGATHASGTRTRIEGKAVVGELARA